jgi:hypothetical protein
VVVLVVRDDFVHERQLESKAEAILLRESDKRRFTFTEELQNRK